MGSENKGALSFVWFRESNGIELCSIQKFEMKSLSNIHIWNLPNL